MKVGDLVILISLKFNIIYLSYRLLIPLFTYLLAVNFVTWNSNTA
jgi:hypothetical protein